MLEVKEAKTKKQKRDFVYLPDKIYKGCSYYVPEFKFAEFELLNEKKNPNYKTCDIIAFVCYRDNAPVGRIMGIIQPLDTEKTGIKKARFSHFDLYNDFGAAEALFAAFEKWAAEKGAVKAHGPLGFTDIDHEGMLIEGFNTIATLATIYNYEYYPVFLERLGYVKDIDWLQYIVYLPPEDAENIVRLKKIAARAREKYGIKVVKLKSRKKTVKEYGRKVLDLVADAYSALYGTVPFTEEVTQGILTTFNTFLDVELMSVIEDSGGRLVGFGLCFASLAKALNKCKGKLFPFGIFRILHAMKHGNTVDLALIAILPEYQSKGVNAIIMTELLKTFYKRGIKFMETNLMMEDNIKILSQIAGFDKVNHKKNRAYIKDLSV